MDKSKEDKEGKARLESTRKPRTVETERIRGRAEEKLIIKDPWRRGVCCEAPFGVGVEVTLVARLGPLPTKKGIRSEQISY